MVPSVIGLFWSRRDHLMLVILCIIIFREGNMTFAQSGVVLEKNKKAGLEGTCLIGCSRALMSIANLTIPLWCMRFFEKNMVFFTPLKGIIFTGMIDDFI